MYVYIFLSNKSTYLHIHAYIHTSTYVYSYSYLSTVCTYIRTCRVNIVHRKRLLGQLPTLQPVAQISRYCTASTNVGTTTNYLRMYVCMYNCDLYIYPSMHQQLCMYVRNLSTVHPLSLLPTTSCRLFTRLMLVPSNHCVTCWLSRTQRYVS